MFLSLFITFMFLVCYEVVIMNLNIHAYVVIL